MRPRTRAAIVAAACVVLAGCASGPAPRGGEGTGARGTPSAPAPSKRGGGYYLDDGPGDSPPAGLELLPDAVPRVEKYASGANRPYNVFGVDYVPDLSGSPYRQRGVGSWYGRKFHGQRTSSGEIYDMYAMTAAHPTLPIPCYALVTNLQNGRSVIVRVNDRGPFLHNRVMDLSYAAAFKLGYLSSGSGSIEVERLMPADIAAGRIPQTTTGLLLAGAAPSTGLTTTSPPSRTPVAEPVTTLTIEALTARVEPSSPALPPAPTLAPDAINRSLPLAPSPKADVDNAPGLVALPDRQPAASLPEIVTGGGFFLQLGAFRAKSGADSFAAHVAREIDPALASQVQVSEAGGLYRVRVGPYAQRGDADRAATNLRTAIAQPVLVMPEGAGPR